jgi:hypothetical protein
LSEEIGKILSSNLNALVILTALDLHDKGFIPLGLDKTVWENLLTGDNLLNEYWLVAYEAKRKGWLTSAVDYISVNPFYKILADNNVSFYKENKVLDLSKVKVNTASGYFGDGEEKEEDGESESVYSSVNRKDEAISNPVNTSDTSEPDDLPF